MAATGRTERASAARGHPHEPIDKQQQPAPFLTRRCTATELFTEVTSGEARASIRVTRTCNGSRQQLQQPAVERDILANRAAHTQRLSISIYKAYDRSALFAEAVGCLHTFVIARSVRERTGATLTFPHSIPEKLGRINCLVDLLQHTHISAIVLHTSSVQPTHIHWCYIPHSHTRVLHTGRCVCQTTFLVTDLSPSTLDRRKH